MDKQLDITAAIKDYFNTLLARWDDFNATQSEDYLRHMVLFDDVHKRYQVLRYGWRNGEYVYNVSIHLDVIDEKVWIQRNTTEEEIVDVLSEHGITNDQVVLGFVDPELRKRYAYGVG